MREDYPYNEALDDLIIFFKKHIKKQDILNELMDLINGCREEKMVSIRAIYETYSKYRKNYNDKFPCSPEEDQMWKDLLYFWQ